MANSYYVPPINKPALEKIQPSFGSSIHYKRFTDEQPTGIANWHFHPEIELVFIDQGNGKRHIGNHISNYTQGDLILIGSGVPHYGFMDRLTNGNTEMVLQFKEDFMADSLSKVIELKRVGDLVSLSGHGLSFYGKTKEIVGKMLEEMANMSHFDRLLQTVRILDRMAQSDEYDILNVAKVTIQTSQLDQDKIKLIYDYVGEHYKQKITIQEMAELTNMTVPSFCRYFKKQTDKTFTQFVNEFKITEACRLLSETSRTIADICFECGFNNFSHFNKQFKIVTGKNPSEYRSAFKRVIG